MKARERRRSEPPRHIPPRSPVDRGAYSPGLGVEGARAVRGVVAQARPRGSHRADARRRVPAHAGARMAVVVEEAVRLLAGRHPDNRRLEAPGRTRGNGLADPGGSGSPHHQHEPRSRVRDPPRHRGGWDRRSRESPSNRRLPDEGRSAGVRALRGHTLRRRSILARRGRIS